MTEPVYYNDNDTIVRDKLAFNSKIILDQFFNLQNVNFATVKSLRIENFGEVIDSNGNWVGGGSITVTDPTDPPAPPPSSSDSVITVYSSGTARLSSALQLASTKSNPCTVYVYPGTYVEDGNIVVPDNVSLVSRGGPAVTTIVASDICRSEHRNMFLVSSGSHVDGFTFKNQEIDNFTDPRGGFAIAFNKNSSINIPPVISNCVQLSNYDPNFSSPQTNPILENVSVGKGGGMILSDRVNINSYSSLPYISAFNVSARSPNGVGFVAKNGAGLYGNYVSAEFQRCSYIAINGGQISLNSCSTKFGDIGFISKGKTDFIEPQIPSIPLAANPDAALRVLDDLNDPQTFEDFWNELQYYSPDWETNISLDETSVQQVWQYVGEFVFTSTISNDWSEAQMIEFKDFAKKLYSCIYEDIRSGGMNNVMAFAGSLYTYEDFDGVVTLNRTIPLYLIDSYVYILGKIKDSIISSFGTLYIQTNMVRSYIDDILIPTIKTPVYDNVVSTIKASDHNFYYVGSGVSNNAIPKFYNRTGVSKKPKYTMIKEDDGRILWSGTDQDNTVYLFDGIEINGRTGTLQGNRLVSQIKRDARRMVNARSYI